MIVGTRILLSLCLVGFLTKSHFMAYWCSVASPWFWGITFSSLLLWIQQIVMSSYLTNVLVPIGKFFDKLSILTWWTLAQQNFFLNLVYSSHPSPPPHPQWDNIWQTILLYYCRLIQERPSSLCVAHNVMRTSLSVSGVFHWLRTQTRAIGVITLISWFKSTKMVSVLKDCSGYNVLSWLIGCRF